MITLPPYLAEWELYRQMPYESRWIFNKLDLAHRLGDQCDPVGVKLPAGDYCVRPTMNISGAAHGGFRRIVLTKPDFIQEPSGYCVTPWTNDFRHWHSFVDDECWYSQHTTHIEGDVEHMEEADPCFQLPQILRGISRYMLVETLGDMIIDVGPKHDLTEVRQEIVDDYRQFDPNYEVPSYCTWGFHPQGVYRTFWDESLKGWRHAEVPHD